MRIFIFIALSLIAVKSAFTIELAERLPACLSCHGETGASSQPEVPSLGAQQEPYVLIQLYLFREKLRLNEIMNAMAHDLKDEDLQTFAHAVAQLPAPKAAAGFQGGAPVDPANALIEKYRCNFCHGSDLAGRDNVPRIASQREDFLVKTMLEYKSNARYGYDASMAEVLAPISEQEIRDLASFISRR